VTLLYLLNGNIVKLNLPPSLEDKYRKWSAYVPAGRHTLDQRRFRL